MQLKMDSTGLDAQLFPRLGPARGEPQRHFHGRAEFHLAVVDAERGEAVRIWPAGYSWNSWNSWRFRARHPAKRLQEFQDLFLSRLTPLPLLLSLLFFLFFFNSIEF